MRYRNFIPLFLAGLLLSEAVNVAAFGQITGGVQGNPFIGQSASDNLKKLPLIKDNPAPPSRQARDSQGLLDSIRLLTQENSPLAQAMQSNGALAEVLRGLALPHPGKPGERQNRERELVWMMLRYMQSAKVVSPEDHQRNLRFFGGLVGILARRSGVQIADLPDQDRSRAFVVPARFLQPGHRGILGAILDQLQDSDYVVRPQVRRWFERSDWLRWFDSSV